MDKISLIMCPRMPAPDVIFGTGIEWGNVYQTPFSMVYPGMQLSKKNLVIVDYETPTAWCSSHTRGTVWSSHMTTLCQVTPRLHLFALVRQVAMQKPGSSIVGALFNAITGTIEILNEWPDPNDARQNEPVIVGGWMNDLLKAHRSARTLWQKPWIADDPKLVVVNTTTRHPTHISEMVDAFGTERLQEAVVITWPDNLDAKRTLSQIMPTVRSGGTVAVVGVGSQTPFVAADIIPITRDFTVESKTVYIRV